MGAYFSHKRNMCRGTANWGSVSGVHVAFPPAFVSNMGRTSWLTNLTGMPLALMDPASVSDGSNSCQDCKPCPLSELKGHSLSYPFSSTCLWLVLIDGSSWSSPSWHSLWMLSTGQLWWVNTHALEKGPVGVAVDKHWRWDQGQSHLSWSQRVPRRHSVVLASLWWSCLVPSISYRQWCTSHQGDEKI